MKERPSNYCIMAECGWACTKTDHALLFLALIIFFPILAIIGTIFKHGLTRN